MGIAGNRAAADTIGAPPGPAETTVDAAAILEQTPPRRESLGNLVRRLVDDIILLIRTELRLARSEMRESIVTASSSMALVGAGTMLISVAMFCLLGATVAWLAQFVGIVAAALIVASVAIAIGALLIGIGIGRLKNIDFTAPRMLANLSRDVETLKGD